MRADAMLPYRTPAAGEPAGTDEFVEGRVVSSSSAGTTFRVLDWDGGKHVFGPAPHVAAGTPGMRCLVLFLGGGIDRPWILGVWPA